jgi:transglutaminase-like putative cysteine protease
VFRVRRGALNQPDFPIAPHAARYPFAYAPEQLVDLTPSIVPDYDPDGVVLNWAQRFVEEADFDTWGILERMTAAVKNEFTYDRREEFGVHSPAGTIASGHGSCRDFAMLMLEGVRRLGFAARFVSGYLYDPALDRGVSTPATDGVIHGAGATHAWVQVFLPGAGWVEFDPTNGLIGHRNLIRTAVARTPGQAAPLTGSFEGAADDQIAMEVEVEVTSQGEEV